MCLTLQKLTVYLLGFLIFISQQSVAEEKTDDWLNPYTILLKEKFKQNGVEKMMVVQYKEGEGTHVSGAHISAAILVKKNGKWKTEIEARNFTEIGGHGNPPNKAKLVEIGYQNFGFLLEGGYTAQGYTTEYAVLIAIVGKKIKEILTINIGENNSGTGCSNEKAPCEFDHTKRIEFLSDQDKNSIYYPIKIQELGTKEENNQIVPAKGMEILYPSKLLLSGKKCNSNLILNISATDCYIKKK